MPRRESNDEWRRRMQESIDRNREATAAGRPQVGRKVFGPPPIQPAIRHPAVQSPAAPSTDVPEEPPKRRKGPTTDPEVAAVKNLGIFNEAVRRFLAEKQPALPLFVAALGEMAAKKPKLYIVFISGEDNWSLSWSGQRAGNRSGSLWRKGRFTGNDRGAFIRLLMNRADEWL